MLELLRAQPARARVRAVVKTIQRSIDWVNKAVAPSLYTLKEVLGEDFMPYLDNLLREGSVKLSNARRRILIEADKSCLVY